MLTCRQRQALRQIPPDVTRLSFYAHVAACMPFGSRHERRTTENSRKKPMTDPRNVAHDKKVQQEKKKHGDDIAQGSEHAPQPGQKPRMQHPEDKSDNANDADSGANGS
jgi:hypothetical protein